MQLAYRKEVVFFSPQRFSILPGADMPPTMGRFIYFNYYAIHELGDITADDAAR